MMLGGQLRRLREAAGITREAAGAAIRASQAKLSRLESGRVGFKERDVADLLTLYGVADESERQEFFALGRRANTPGWWHKYSDVLPGWFETYLGLEQAASIIRTYDLQFIPGLLQTEDYARAVTLLGHVDADEVDQRVELRLRRQRILTQDGAPRLWAVVDEAALRRPVAGPAAMRAQLSHLIEMIGFPNVTVQVVPFRFGGHAATGGPFTILRFVAPDLPDIVYLEQLTSALYLGKRNDVERYGAVMDSLCARIELPVATAAILTEIHDQL
ncbi:MAG: helix-turn-helix domain-containing protein [Pseudonocardia sp.]